MAVYHAHPYSSFERGTNERVNGLLRRYLPKGTDLANLTQNDLQDIVDQINDHPLKCLGWLTPNEAFHQALESTPSVTVALQN
jgi:IS30 family transposase